MDNMKGNRGLGSARADAKEEDRTSQAATSVTEYQVINGKESVPAKPETLRSREESAKKR